LPDAGQIDSKVIFLETEALTMCKLIGELGTVNNILRWETGYIRARAANVATLDDRCALALPGERPSQIFPSFATSEGNEIVVFRGN
jgi:hypothetical protein